jgi:hypothetical protein
MSSEQAKEESDLLQSLGVDLDKMNSDIATETSAFGLDLDETTRNPKGSDSEQDHSADEESALSGMNSKPRTFPKAPGTMVKSPVGRGATLAARRGQDGPIFTFEAYGYEEKEERKTEASCFCFDTSAEIAIGKSKISGNNVVKLNRLTLKALEEDLRVLLTKDNYAHVHHCIETFLRVHIEEGNPLPVKIVRRLG